MVVAVVVAVAVAAQLHPNATDYRSPEVDCLRIISSASSFESFPLPYPVDLRAHEDILNLHELPDLEILMSLNRTRSDVCSTLAATTQALVTYISNATKIYKSFASEYTTDAFYADTLLVSEQLRIASSSVNHFAQVYYILQEDYYAVDYTTEEAFKQGQLSGLTRVLVYAQPRGLLQRLGLFDAHEAYLGPLEEKARKLEEAHLGVVALEREVQRVVQIEQVIGEVERSLQILASAVQDIETNSHHRPVKSRKGRELIQKQLKEWYLQHIIQNRQLTESWMELLASVNRGEKEEELGMNISTAWCPRSG